jgi:putative component of membrane protein insertase Oxa1/YidC/SpoIIIJ protein YidD
VKGPLLALIRFYWRWWPARWRRTCLFRESCSHHVHRITAQEGVRAGLRAAWRRVRACRPGFAVEAGPDGLGLRLRDGSLLAGRELNPRLFTPGPMPGAAR